VKHLGLKPVRQLEPALRKTCQRYRESAHRTPGSITLDAPLMHLGGGDIGFNSGSRGGEAMTIVAAGSQGANRVPMAGVAKVAVGNLRSHRWWSAE